MKKILILLLFGLFFLNSCTKPFLDSVVDKSLFSEPYKKPLILLVYNGKIEKKVANILFEKIKVSFDKNSKIKPVYKSIDVSMFDKAKFEESMENSFLNGEYDILFNIDLEKISLYERSSVVDFTFLISAFDFKIKKEVWKSRVFSPRHSIAINDMATQLVLKLKSDNVL